MPTSVYLGSQSYFVPINPQNITPIDGGMSLEIPGQNGVTAFRFSEDLANSLPRTPFLAAIKGELILEVSVNSDCFAEGCEIVMVKSFNFLGEAPAELKPDLESSPYFVDPAQPHLI
jgi:hypothetical protein